MTVPAEAAGIRRIVLALEHAGIPPFTLDLALRLARRLDTELTTTLIENSNLLRAAGFPFAREFLQHTGTERTLDAARLADQLRQGLRRLQSDLEARADAGGVRASFRILRASGVHVAFEPRPAGGPGDVIFFSHATGLSPATEPATPRILVVQTDAAMNERVESVVRDLLEGLPAATAPRVERIRMNSVDQVAASCRGMHAALLVMPATLAPADLRALIERAGCPVLAIG